ncbi:MAG: phosphatidylserine decarboxylase [Opitutales bacterium]|nr:phosphatidylserine decarboxylase [Opitutales bacterium]
MSEAIRYFHRERGVLESEPVYGERWLRWAYENPLGRLTVAAVAKRAWFSRWYGRRMSTAASRRRIAPFVETYGVDPREFAGPVSAFRSFNDFFVRKLRPEARPIVADEGALAFPADGRHLGFADVDEAPGIYAKGQRFSVRDLFAGSVESVPKRAAVVISRLCPLDYHRFHFADAGRAGHPSSIPGDLFSVSPIALRRSLNYLFANKRVVTEIQHASGRTFWQVEVGATNVGGIVQTYEGNSPVERGTEKGFFHFGGSCVITVFPADAVELADDLCHHSAAQTELFAKMGARMGRWRG